MFTSNLSRSARNGALIALALATCLMAVSPARAAGGTIQFHATVSGKSHDSGSFSRAVQHAPSGQPLLALLFVGCAVVKQSAAGGPATYQLQVRTGGTAMPGMKPTGPGVNLTIDNFHHGTASATYTGSDVSGTFAINGHAYGDGSTVIKSAARVTKGGLSGAWTDTAAVRIYPAKGVGTVSGFQFHATWHCTTLLHVTTK